MKSVGVLGTGSIAVVEDDEELAHAGDERLFGGGHRPPPSTNLRRYSYPRV